MASEEEGPRTKRAHIIGERLDDLSVHEFDERIALLRAEIARLESAKVQKQYAVDQAGSVFRR